MERRRVTRETDTDFNLNVGSSSGEQQDLLLNNLPSEQEVPQQSNLQGDKLNIAILFFLYVLQGIPLGLAGSIPMILQNRNVSYKQQAEFSFVHWPFSIKLLWAPIVDAVFLRRFGRRKTWLIPTQYLIGLFLIVLSSSVNSLLGSSTEAPNVFLLTVMFFSINSLAATQDIAVDGWALTMLSRRNVGYASTCNSVGQTAGFFLGNVVFLALESASFCNSYLRSEPQPEGIVTLAGFMKFWGIIFFITTTLVMIFKSEREEQTQVSDIKDSYIKLFRIICLNSVKLIIGFLVTCKIAFAAETVTGLKLMEAGVKKEHLALLAVPIVPLQIMLPLVISKYTSGPRPLSVFMKAYPLRMLLGLLFSVLVWWTYKVKLEDGSFPIYYYIVITLVYALHQITVYCIFVALMSFFAQVSDPSIGGTYMTLLNTICNIGSNWPSTLALWWVDPLTSRYCEGSSLHSCDTKELSLKCTESGHTCAISVDGYYIETVICIIFGFVWLRWGKSAVQRLQQLPLTAWKTNR